MDMQIERSPGDHGEGMVGRKHRGQLEATQLGSGHEGRWQRATARRGIQEAEVRYLP